MMFLSTSRRFLIKAHKPSLGISLDLAKPGMRLLFYFYFPLKSYHLITISGYSNIKTSQEMRKTFDVPKVFVDEVGSKNKKSPKPSSHVFQVGKWGQVGW